MSLADALMHCNRQFSLADLCFCVAYKVSFIFNGNIIVCFLEYGIHFNH